MLGRRLRRGEKGENMIKPITTLFMIMSVDGKISTGCTDDRDVDKDFPHIEGISNGLSQYYDIEKTTDLFSMNSGRVMAKMGVNSPKKDIKKIPVSFIIIDNKPHLTDVGVDYFINMSKDFFLVTTNKNHPAFQRENEKNLHIIYYFEQIKRDI
jgi:2,5-diamino-6-(ribosylamino)-4(3H)-pyrimidinone 5'-phosphate reductase